MDAPVIDGLQHAEHGRGTPCHTSAAADNVVDAVDIQQAHAGRRVDQYIATPHAGTVQAEKLSERFHMITRDEYDPDSVIGILENGLHDFVMGMIPVSASHQLPTIQNGASGISESDWISAGGRADVRRATGLCLRERQRSKKSGSA